MSEHPIFRLGRLTVTPVATIGYPRWGLRFKNPRRCYGLFAELDVPWDHYEFRWKLKRYQCEAWRDGKRCRMWAVSSGYPPLCAVHGGR